MRYLLDTSVYSQPIKKKPEESVIFHWKKLNEYDMAIAIFCEMEVLQGLYIKKSKRLWDLHNKILKDRFPLLDFDKESSQIYAEIQADMIKNGKRRPVIDLMIASIAIRHNLILVTCNPKDFLDIQDLKMENWSIR